MSLQGSWSDDGRPVRHTSASAEYLHRQDTTGSTNSPEAPLTRQRDLWPEPTPGLPGQQLGSEHTTPELMVTHGKRLQQPASVETTASAQTVIPHAAADCSLGRQVQLLGPLNGACLAICCTMQCLEQLLCCRLLSEPERRHYAMKR